MHALGQTGGTVPYVPSYKGPHTEHNSRTFPLLLHYYVKSERGRGSTMYSRVAGAATNSQDEKGKILEYYNLLCNTVKMRGSTLTM